MKKLLKKLICLVLATACVLTSVGCLGEEDEVTVDSSRTQLYVGIVPSGYGTSWLYNLIDEFEDTYKDYEFEPGTGKKGVQVIVESVSYGNTIATVLPNSSCQIVITSDVNYSDLINRKLIYDMTDILKDDYEDTDVNGNKITTNLYSKYGDEIQRDDYTDNGKIYALPFCAGDEGISYDRDLFEEKGWFFIATDPANNDYHAYYEENGGKKEYALGNSQDNVLSMGRDGVAGTYDDGLPATYEQFYYLMEQIALANVTPITWTGKYISSYLVYFLYGIWAQNEGATNMKMNVSLRGTATDLIDHIDTDGTIHYMDPVEITDENGYLLHNQAGKYYALDFLYNIIKILKEKDTMGYDMAFKESIDHLDAQDNFLKSVVRSQNDSSNYKRIAMFRDGCYWENEAMSTYIAMGEGYGRKDRQIGWMPIPHPTTEGAGNVVFQGSGTAITFMNAKTDDAHIDVSKKFLQLMYSRKSLVKIAQDTSMILPMKFEASEAEIKEMSYFGQCLYNKYKSSDLLNTMSSNPVYKTHYSLFSTITTRYWSTLSADLGNTDNPAKAFQNLKGSAFCDARIYFNAMQQYFTKSWWDSSVLGK